MLVPSEEPSIQDMADIYLAEYLSESHGESVSPSGRHPVTYIVYQTGDHFNLYCVFDRDGSSASNHHELLFGLVSIIVWEASAVRIVFFHFESNRIVELLFEISNRIE